MENQPIRFDLVDLKMKTVLAHARKIIRYNRIYVAELVGTFLMVCTYFYQIQIQLATLESVFTF